MDETRPGGEVPRFVPQTILDGKYRIERVIGEGAFGRVYLATDPRLRRPVAVKELLASRNATDPETYARYQDRFSREARAGGAITHPNVVTVYEMAVDRAQNTYLVMEYVDGTNLRDLLTQVNTLPQERVLAVALDIARALDAVHEADIVHRDLKPANIMISRRGTAKVGDFGIAQVGTESQRTQVTMGHPGTPLYMSPEQASGFGYIDGRSDLYSLGLVIYEMLVGEPYLRRRIPLAQAKPDTAPALIAIVNRLLERDPDRRFQSASEVVTELSRISGAPQAGTNLAPLYPPIGPSSQTPPPPGPYVNMPGQGAAPPIPGYGSYPGSAGYVPPPASAPPYGGQGSQGGQAGHRSPPPYANTAPYAPPPAGPPAYAAGPAYATPPRRSINGCAIFAIGCVVLLVVAIGSIAIALNRFVGVVTSTATADAGLFGASGVGTGGAATRTSVLATGSPNDTAANRPAGTGAVVSFWVTETAVAMRGGTTAPTRAATATRAGGTGTTGTTGATLADKNNHYSFTIPKGWQSHQSDNSDTDLEVIGTQPPGVLRTVSQTTAVNASLDAATIGVIAGLKQSNSTFMQIGSTQNATVNGQPAKRIDFTLTDSGVDLRGAMYVMTKGKLVVGVAFFAAPDDLDAVLMQTRIVLDTFTFT